MIKYLKKKLRNYLIVFVYNIRYRFRLEQLLINQGKILSELNRGKIGNRLCDYEWKVFSQWGEDGIIQFLTNMVEIKNRTFIEVGIEDFRESNCRYLLMNNDWRGFVVDGSDQNISRLRSFPFFWQHDLTAVCSFVTAENINHILLQSKFSEDLGILSIDIDGNDYHILKAINSFEPRIIICEFNPYFGTKRAITVPYDPHFYRTDAHYSNLYYGASIKAIEHLLAERGYTLIGTGLMGANAYFVRDDLVTDHLHNLAKHPYHFTAHARESRDQKGNLTFLRNDERLNEMRGLKVVNVLNEQEEKL